MPRGKLKSIAKNRRAVYERLKSRLGKTRAARIANAGRTRAARKAMSRKAARTRQKGS